MTFSKLKMPPTVATTSTFTIVFADSTPSTICQSSTAVIAST
jgi:hypothetical protein